jgi:hypothetical protein
VAKAVQARVKKLEGERRLAGRSGARSFQTPSCPPLRSFQGTWDFTVRRPSIYRLLDEYSTSSGIAVFDLLPAITSNAPSICFSDALTATAMAAAARRSYESRLFEESRGWYMSAISNLRKIMQPSKALDDDSVLLALFLLGLYEVSTRKHGKVYRSLQRLCALTLGDSSWCRHYPSSSSSLIPQDATHMLLVLLPCCDSESAMDSIPRPIAASSFSAVTYESVALNISSPRLVKFADA